MHRSSNKRNAHRRHRQVRIRAKIFGTAARPRLSVFRSLRHLTLQLIDDRAGRTLVAATDRELPDQKQRGLAQSRAVGVLLAQKAKAKDITQAVFDRSGYRYHGHVRAVAEGAREGAREGGLTF